jgi:alpha-galactosidase
MDIRILGESEKRFSISYVKGAAKVFSQAIKTFPTKEKNPDIEFQIEAKKIDQHYIISSHIKNISGQKITIEAARPLIFSCDISKKDLSSYRFFLNGFQSFSGTGSFGLDEKEKNTRILSVLRVLHHNMALPKNKKQGWFCSDSAGLVYSKKHDLGLCLGFLDFTKFFSQIGTERKNSTLDFYTQVQTDHILLKPDDILAFPPLFLCEAEDCSSLLELWAGLVAREMKIEKITPKKNGWCSWYHYFTNINEHELYKNLKILKEKKESFPLEIFQLDDGYSSAMGDWLSPNSKFSSLKDVAHKIKDAGFIPGIWLAPFMVRMDSQLYKEHPEWVLKDKKNKPVVGLWNPNWGILGRSYALDITHPGFQEHLKNIIATFTYDFGFEFIKIDFLYAACLPGVWFDKTLTTAEIMRLGLSLIREACKSGTIILGCGCPLGPAIGLVDYMRIGNDVTPHWTDFVSQILGQGFEQLATKNNIRNTLARTFIQGKWWINDPDCLLVRKVKNKLTETEVITLSTVIALSGGTVIMSDDLMTLDAKRSEIAKNVLKISSDISENAERYYCPDFMLNKWPEIQVAQTKKRTYLAVYNFGDKPVRKEYDLKHVKIPAKIFVKDFWTGKQTSIENARLDAGLLEPHACRLYIIDHSV